MCWHTKWHYLNCNAILYTDEICVEHIAHTLKQIDNEPCPKADYRRKTSTNRCRCKLNGAKCLSEKQMSKDDGHIYSFERAQDREFKRKQLEAYIKREEEEFEQQQIDYEQKEKREAEKAAQEKRRKISAQLPDTNTNKLFTIPELDSKLPLPKFRRSLPPVLDWSLESTRFFVAGPSGEKVREEKGKGKEKEKEQSGGEAVAVEYDDFVKVKEDDDVDTG